MKRSEMVNKLAQSIIENMSSSDNMIIVADNVLKKLEEQGMLAPDNCSKNCHKENYENCGNVWEPEDDSDNYCGAV